jgi:hypothetical protein
VDVHGLDIPTLDEDDDDVMHDDLDLGLGSLTPGQDLGKGAFGRPPSIRKGEFKAARWRGRSRTRSAGLIFRPACDLCHAAKQVSTPTASKLGFSKYPKTPPHLAHADDLEMLW